ncbi:MAG TPA: TonB-dependent receptor, partial [Longimicrobiales bacterium]|nr:TonB-dependent receptor [Longimicrobiales bacterium]
LPHVTVEVVDSRVRVMSGLDGRYVVNNVPSGEVALRAQSIGYAAKTVTSVQVRAGSAVELNITLDPSAVELAAIEVSASAERGSVSRALELQRNSTNVMSGIAAEQIARSPDSDAAAAVQRISGVTVQDGRYVFVRGLGERYTTTSLNGSRIPSPEPERKMVPLDLFPAGMLQTITTAKTFTPDLPGDFSGAQVDIRTREYPARRQLNLSLSQGYNSAVTGRALPMAPREGGEWLALAAGPRLMPEVVGSTPRPQPGTQTNQMVNAMRNAWSTENRNGSQSSSVGFSLGGTDPVLGRDFGYLVSGTYSAGDEANLGAIRENPEGDRYEGTVGRHSVLVGGLLNLSTMFGTHSRISLNNSYNRSADNEARIEQGFYENHGTNIQIERLRYIERWVRSNQLAGQHQLAARHRLDWAVTSSAVSRQEPDRSEFVTWLDPAVPTWYNQEGAFRAYGGLKETGFEASASYRIDIGASRNHAIRFGGLYRTTERDAFDNGYAIRTRDWTPTDPRWQLRPEDLFDGRYSTNGEQLFELGIFNAGGNYRAEDRIVAGFAMVEWAPAPRLRIVGGARVEQSELEVGYQDVLGNLGVSNPSYTDVLPSATLIYDLTGTQKIRLSASQTLARPEYREVAPICYRAGLGEEQRCGNPDLSRTLIQNYDLRWEHYPQAGEVLSVALFAKRFADPIEPRYQGRSGTNSLWFQNAESAVNYGVELEAMRSLEFVAEALAPFTAFANVTVMKSEVRTGVDGDPTRAMTGQAPYVVNAGLTWTSAGRGATSATVLFNVVGERIINARPSGQNVQDMLEQPRPGLDLSLRFPVLGTVAGKIDLKNLLDSPYEVRQGDLLRSYYRSGRSASIGLSWSR